MFKCLKDAFFFFYSYFVLFKLGYMQSLSLFAIVIEPRLLTRPMSSSLHFFMLLKCPSLRSFASNRYPHGEFCRWLSRELLCHVPLSWNFCVNQFQIQGADEIRLDFWQKKLHKGRCIFPVHCIRTHMMGSCPICGAPTVGLDAVSLIHSFQVSYKSFSSH